ncbi:hypothetical protein CPAR01_15461 [Colletotrichum paranaense]|uniref:Uncharacterized protein n=2 Tax=Colletotrichum acutatum species complex TaxID=2707335 RepID=A0AAI9V219_9PEZI|nr:uncharacterized protein CPAR01_15461 [Colletotrichum paranaense]KAK1468820.1 hypothetical protein CMEL01_00587 [Colletotrichum melonis]KAK1519968.1 hypothetical protein CPAR01_15461 [Colletotrichum paranaense]
MLLDCAATLDLSCLGYRAADGKAGLRRLMIVVIIVPYSGAETRLSLIRCAQPGLVCGDVSRSRCRRSGVCGFKLR